MSIAHAYWSFIKMLGSSFGADKWGVIVQVNKLEIKILSFKKEVGIAIKSKETNS